jgi:hypothetical protein
MLKSNEISLILIILFYLPKDGSMFKKVKLNLSVNRLQEEKLYEYIAFELASDDIKLGLWTKALAFSDGDDGKTKSLYIQYRLQSLIDQGRVDEFLLEFEQSKNIAPTKSLDVTSKNSTVNVTPTKQSKSVNESKEDNRLYTTKPLRKGAINISRLKSAILAEDIAEVEEFLNNYTRYEDLSDVTEFAMLIGNEPIIKYINSFR